MPPRRSSHEELSLLGSLAEPVAYGQRREFLQAVAAALEAFPSKRAWRDVPHCAMFNAGSSQSQRAAPERETPPATRPPAAKRPGVRSNDDTHQGSTYPLRHGPTLARHSTMAKNEMTLRHLVVI
jgi:hypothetical protein